jgi:serine phosphatase RsbU (regulator of sigma subunit)
VLGALALSSAPSGRRFDERHLTVAEELGRRAGTALDNARQHDSRARIATTLQRSLLPPRLPDVPGLVLAARFRSAEEGTEVGGDFYDVFGVGEAWYAVMGDVTGKGPAAAAVTGLARYTLRAAATYEQRPSDALHRLNTTLLGEQRQCSAVCARLERSGPEWRATVACAGHPMPFVLRPGQPPRALGRPGTLGGAFPEGQTCDDTATLAPGDTLLFYTDGVTDARGVDGRYEVGRLVALLGTLAGAGADTVVQTVDDAVREFQVGRQRDDVALLALEVES